MLLARFKNAIARLPYVRRMNRLVLAVVLIAAIACKAEEESGNAFDRAAEAAGRAKMKEAAALYAEASRSETDPVRRAKAAIKAANIEWRMFEQHDAAKARLERVAAGEHEAVDAHLELGRIALELKKIDEARAHVQRAVAAAKTKRERNLGTLALARLAVESRDAAQLPAAVDSLRAHIAEQGPRLQSTRLLLKAALLTGNGAAAMEAVDGYYHVSKFKAPPNAIAAAHAALARVLPAWRGTDPERAAIAQGLMGVRFFEEAAIVSREPIPYAAAIKRIEKATLAYYRELARGDGDDDDLHDAVKRELKPFGSKEEQARRFGTYYTIGKTGGFIDLHYGHVVGDRTLQVEQYGRKASLRFVELDAMVSNGYGTFLTDESGGDGGWATDKEIYQVRPMYANGPLGDWQYFADEETRARQEREMAEDTERDRERARLRPIREFAGLNRRLYLQYLNAVMAGLRAQNLTGDALRDAFLARIENDEFESSILLHEGRHAIDKLSKERFKVWELEYRAKLSEVALAGAPRAALQSILDNTIGGDDPHGKANETLAKGLVAWMEKQKASIAGLDPGLPLMPQLDKLTDEQIKAAVRSLDPLAGLKAARSQSRKGGRDEPAPSAALLL
jgi:hypothetical protein